MLNIKQIILINSRMHCVKQQTYVLKISKSNYTPYVALKK